MIINPKYIVDQKIVEGEGFEIQQNGIDITLSSASLVSGGILSKNSRKINEYVPMSPEENNHYVFFPNQAYAIEFEQKVKVPDNMCAQIIQRSTLNRMGGFVLSGLYDSGFQNVIGAILRTSCEIRIEKGARVAQIIFQEASPASLYNGVYQAK